MQARYLYCIVVLSAAVLRGQTTDAARIQQLASTIAKLHKAWDPAMNSPNASISLKEISRSGQTFHYRLIAKGFPGGLTFNLIAWPITQRSPSPALQGIKLDSTGQAMCAGTPDTCGTPAKPNDPLDLKITAAKGEPFRMGLISQDKKWKAFLKIVPLPNEGRDGKCVVQSVMLMPFGAEVVVQGSGFQPNAELTMQSDSEGEQHSGKIHTDQNGEYFEVMLPAVAGKQGGTTHVHVKAPECSPSISFQWGRL